MNTIASPKSTSCTRHAFGGCDGNCGATCPNRAADIVVEPRRHNRFERQLIALIILTAIAGGAMGNSALHRVERSYQMARV
jgi:hypothetical protein